MFKVGQKVVCVDDTDMHLHRDDVGPCDGDVLTIRAIRPQDEYGDVSFLFEEIQNRPRLHTEGVTEVSFLCHRFRPVQETGMEMLRAILIRPNAPVKEDA